MIWNVIVVLSVIVVIKVIKDNTRIEPLLAEINITENQVTIQAE